MEFCEKNWDNPGVFPVFPSGGHRMHIYSNLIILGVSGAALLAFSSFQVLGPAKSFLLSLFSYAFFFVIAIINARTWLEKEHNRKISDLKEKYEKKIKRLKFEHDIATLEKTIRDGTKTLIKNAVDYFKIENIKNEMPPSAAIQNLQLDKYGQIIELLADFSLILPDYEENRQIVLQEINHQIQIYEIDEKHFATFLQTIMGKYILTVNKKIREKLKQRDAYSAGMKPCPRCLEDIPTDAESCDHCGYILISDIDPDKGLLDRKEAYSDWIQKGYALAREKEYDEAVRMFSLAIDVNPKSGQAYYNRGLAYKKMNMPKEAVKDIETAIRLGHANAEKALSKIMSTEKR